ncbi:alpha/beta hydrolase [Actinoplanes derwentensis]|uniref:Xaa-Pro dipeptidyl-peptidase-like domain-containing protein n=1 Tax=Actinoplanes derwentensis TaxID=113562 RepID=A0A1H1YR43_9ACTN|nr:alpha/beta hydrolase [Actinoplanes derwentensis]GID81253.1 hypothetical protein Ade03nite_01770 [Actinoplanes derwentensis]SDT23883.1 hypothetical protein SAMN04489716_2961 [Actinoplanes derwentensis]
MKTHVTFLSSGLQLAGILFLPETPPTQRLPAALPDTPAAQRRPAIVVGHPGSGVKEQSASLYAERLADAGFAVLVYDAAYQGESEGEPRGLENPFQRAEDIKSAVSFLTTRHEIDADRIGALGICASGGYVAWATQTDVRIKAVATISASDLGAVMRDGLGGGQDPEVLRTMLALSAAARTAEARGAGVQRQEWITEAVDDETREYYRTPLGQHPRAGGTWPVRSLDQVIQSDMFAMIELIAPRPLLMIIGSMANTAYMSRNAIARAAEPKELFVVDGGTHISMYHQNDHVTQAVAKLTTFFGQLA